MLILAQTVNKAKNEAKVQISSSAWRRWKVGVSDLQLRREANGGAALSGTLENYKAKPGHVVTLTFHVLRQVRRHPRDGERAGDDRRTERRGAVEGHVQRDVSNPTSRWTATRTRLAGA
jgi:hypothetical protein